MSISFITDNKQRLFWLLQLGGWGAWVVTYYLGVVFWGEAPPNYHFYLPVIAVIGIWLTLMLRLLYRHTWNWRPVWRGLLVLAASYGAGLAWMATRTHIFFAFYPAERLQMMEKGGLYHYFANSLSAASVMLVWSAIYFGIKYYLLNQEEKRRYLTLMSQAHEAQLKMLRYQLNPHFLFNTLNAISTLILDRDSDTANTMVTKLSHFLRYSLDNDPMQQVTVAQEIESLKLYLDIEKVRFEERLSLQFEVAPGVQNALMPSLLLQPLVENAIKYAISTAIHGGCIAVSAQREGGRLVLQVADDGPGIDLDYPPSSGRAGVGLVNTQERLQELYGTDQKFELLKSQPHGLTVRIAVPLEFQLES